MSEPPWAARNIIFKDYDIENKSIIDFGCGDKSICNYLNFSNYVGYDLNPKADYNIDFNSNFTITHTADIGLVLGVLEYLDDPNAFIENDYFKFEFFNASKNNDEIFMISGFNKHPSIFSPNQFYSKIGSIWGWGTWRNRWIKYDVELKTWKNNYTEIELKKDVNSKIIFQKLVNDFNAIKNNKIDTWDIQVQFLLLKEKMYCVYPKKNLITNIGIIGHHSTGLTTSHNRKSSNKLKFLEGVILKENRFYEFSYLKNILLNKLKSLIHKAIF